MISHARACKLFNCSRMNKYYSKKMPSKDAPIKLAIESVLSGKRRGRKKVIAMLRKKHSYSKSRIRRVYEQYGFALYYKPKKRLPEKVKNPISRSLAPNQEWAMDFMSDSLANGRAIRSLNIIDHFNLECKGIRIYHSIPAIRLIEILEEVIETHGKPLSIRTDNGPEFTSKRFQLWLKNNEIKWNEIQKGKPQQNAIIERFNRTMREELFDAHLLFSIEHANNLAAEIIHDYNYVRPHESLKDETPKSYAA